MYELFDVDQQKLAQKGTVAASFARSRSSENRDLALLQQQKGDSISVQVAAGKTCTGSDVVLARTSWCTYRATQKMLSHFRHSRHTRPVTLADHQPKAIL